MADQPGVSSPYPDAPGVQKYNSLIKGGFSPGEANQWAQQQTAKLQAGGFKPSEIDAYWGSSTPQNTALAKHVAQNYTDNAASDAKVATDPMQAFHAGWDISVTGLAVNGTLPKLIMPQNAGLFSRVMAGAGQFTGDVPASIAGFFGGAALGAGGGAAAAAPTGEAAAPITVPIGTVIGAGFGAGATPEAGRQILLDAYKARDGRIKTWQDAVHVIGSSLWETTKAGATGAVANFAGGKAGEIVLKAGANELISGGVNATAQVASATAAGAALDGHMPDAKDFTAAAIIALGLHGAGAVKAMGSEKVGRVQSNLETLYRQTGIPPWDALDRASKDPNFKQELMGQDPNGDPVTPQFRNVAPGDPPPFKPEVKDTGLMEPHTVGWVEPRSMTNVAPAKGPAPRGEPASASPSTVYATDVPHAMSLLAKLEGSGDHAVSPAGAIGKYQIMPATARQYMGNDFDVKTLFDPAVNEAVAQHVVADLHKRYNGDMNAIAIAYNAGPGRAGQYLKAGPGTALVAIPDKTLRGGIRYEQEPARHDESFLPTETQHYLANERRRLGPGHEPPGGGDGEVPPKFPNAGGSDEGGQGGGGGGKPPVPTLGNGGDEPPPRKPGDGYEGSWSDEILKNIGEQPDNRPSVLNLDRIMSQFVSELTPFRNIDNRLVNAKEMDRARDVGAEDMARQTYGSDSRTAHFVKYGAVDPITMEPKPNTPSIMDAVRQVKEDGGTKKEWTAYMLAKRTKDKAAQGINTGFNEGAAEDGVADAKAQKKYERGTKLFNDVMDSVLQYSRESGVHSQAQVDAMIRDNPAYLSMRRIMGDDESFSGGGSRGFGTSDRLRQMEGSDRQIIDPIKATLDNMRLIVSMADRNRLAGHIVGLAERGEISPDLGIRKIEDQQTIQAADEKTFKPYGLPPEAAETYKPLLAVKAAKGNGPNDFTFIRDGVPERWTTSDPLLAQGLRGADSPGQANIVMKTFQTFASVERAGIVVSPDFPTKVTIRHQITAFIADPLHPAPFLTWIRGIGHVVGQSEEYQRAMSSGAFGVAMADMDTNWLARDMDHVFDETSTWKGVVNQVSHPLELAQLISEKMDAAARVGYVIGAESKGIDLLKAGMMARKAYLDYAEKATSNIVNGMAQVVPFFRPHILGMKQFGEAMGERPASTLAFGVAAVALPTMALYAINHFQDQFLPEDQKWANIPQWQKDNYFITPVIGGTRFRLRTPPNMGFVMGGMVNRMLDTLVNQDPHAFEGWAQKFLGEYVPPLLPTVAQAPLEVMTNHSFFTGQSLIPSSMEKDSGYMQYSPNTSETGKALSRALGAPGLDVADFSPIQFDQFVKGWTGSIGADVLKALDLPFAAGHKPGELADIPFVGSFMTRNPGLSAQPIQTFYNLADKQAKKEGDFATAMKRAAGGNVDEVQETAPGGQIASAVGPVKEALGVQIAAVQGINANKDMTPTEKRQAIDALMPNIIDTAKQGIKLIDSLPKSKPGKGVVEDTPPPAPDDSQTGMSKPLGTSAPPAPPPRTGQVPIA